MRQVEIDIDLLEKIIKYLGDGFVYDEHRSWENPNICYICGAEYPESGYNIKDYLKHKDDCEFNKVLTRLVALYDSQ